MEPAASGCSSMSSCPISKPALAAVAVFAVLGSWSDFIGPLIYIQSTNLMPLSLGLEYLEHQRPMMGQIGRNDGRFGYHLLPMLLVFLLLQRHFVRGITMGAIKG